VKQLVVSVLLVVALVTPAAAAPPASFGIELDLASRDIQEEDGNVDEVKGTADTTSISGQFAVGIVRGVSLYGEVGAADVSVDEFDGYQSAFNLLYGGGIRLSAPASRYAGSVLFFSDLHARHVTSSDRLSTQICTANCSDPSTAVVVSDTVDEDLKWWEYTLKFGASGRYTNLRPFGGIEVSKLDGTDTIRSVSSGLLDQELDVRESNSIGFFLGADILLDPQGQSAVTIEMSAIDRYAFKVGFNVGF
jgi:hypothetical protein